MQAPALRLAQMIDTLTVGGAQHLQIAFAQEARRRGLRPTVIGLGQKEDASYTAQLRSLGASVLNFPSGRMLDPRRIWRLVGLLRREQFHVLQTHLAYANIVGAIAGYLADVPVVATLHSTGSDPQKHQAIRNHLETWALRYGARRVVAVGQAVQVAHRDRLRGKATHIIPNAVNLGPRLDPGERAAIRAAISGDACQPLLISVGRLSPPKAFHDLLTAFAALRRAEPSAFLAIIGSGPLADDLAAQIAALGLEGHAALLGARDDVPRLLAASDVFVSSSRWEGLPLAVLEAMSAGLPVVATNVGDVAWALNGTGIVVPPQEPAALAEAIRSLLNDPERRRALGAAARARVVSHFSTTAWFDQILAVYQEVCPALDIMSQAAT